MEQIILFIFLALFPLGQVIRIGIVQPIDIVAGIAAAWAILKGYKKPEVFKYFNIFLLVAVFSWILSVFLLQRVEVLYGGLYLFRLIAYFYFFVFVWNFVKRKSSNIKLLLNSLLSISVIAAIFGWIQFFMFPDTRALYYLGWDDHFHRLIGTFLDPAFIGLIIAFGALIAIHSYLTSKKARYVAITLFMILSLAFTYSRASYLAFFGGLFVILLAYKRLKYFVFAALGFLVIMFLLPTRDNTILLFTRTFSAINRLENYAETVAIFKTSPLFGVGYDNLCLARAKSAGFINYASHSCSGSDSSILFILATTGVIGFVAFLQSVIKFGRRVTQSPYRTIVLSCLAALLVHSLFSNSLFYSWIMGYLFILVAVGLGSKVKG